MKRIIVILLIFITTNAYAATRDVVPQADSEGSLGTASKYWAGIYADDATFNTLFVDSNKVNLSDTDEDNVLTFNAVTGVWSGEASSASPGGSTPEVQFNSSGSFAGDPQMVFHTTTNSLEVFRIGFTTPGDASFSRIYADGNNIDLSDPNDNDVLTWDAATNTWSGEAGGAGGTPGGSNTHIQFNNSGAFGGEAAFAWDETNDKINLGVSGSDSSINFPDDLSPNTSIYHDESQNSIIFTAPSTIDPSGYSSGNFIFQGNSKSSQQQSRAFFKDTSNGRGFLIQAQNASTELCAVHPSGGAGIGFPGAVNAVTPVNAVTVSSGFPAQSDNTEALGTSSYRWTEIHLSQSVYLSTTTVAGLGTATAGRIRCISDGADATDCTTGGGSTFNVCVGNGATWEDLT